MTLHENRGRENWNSTLNEAGGAPRWNFPW